MLDELYRLRDNPHLASLLVHYSQVGVADRLAWQYRLMTMEGVPAPELSRLHGELIAFDWIEQNSGVTSGNPSGVPRCYRITTVGLRALKLVHAGFNSEEDVDLLPGSENPADDDAKPRRKRSRKPASAENQPLASAEPSCAEPTPDSVERPAA